MEVFAILRGSVKIVIWTREPKALEEFWRRSKTGQLREDLEKVLITEELKQLANGDAVELEVTFSEDEYIKAHEYLGTEDSVGLKRIRSTAKSEKLPEDTISSLEGKTMPTKVGNFIRLARLLTYVGAKALRGLLNSKIAPEDLAKKLDEQSLYWFKEQEWTRLMLRQPRWELFYPPHTDVTDVVRTKPFSITLLIDLLTEKKIFGIAPPIKGWYDLPISKDTSLKADLARIKYYNHKIHEHMDNGMQVSHGDFKDDWDNIKGAILRIVRHYSDPSVLAVWEEDINHCLTGPLSDDDEIGLQKQMESLEAPKHFTFPTVKGDETAKEEEELARRLQETKITSDFATFDGDIFEDSENKFQAHLAVITSKDQVEKVLAELKKKDRDVAEATHNIWAYRIFDAEKNAYLENCDDDGDDTSGARVLRFLQRTEATDVMIVVSCWYETTADDLGPVRFKYIQKSVLDLILACRIVELQTSKIKKYFEEIKYTPFEKVKEQETPKFEILHGEPIEDRKSTFQGHLAEIISREQVDQVLAELKKDRNIAKAKYNMWACRIYDEKKKSYLEEGNDDGENQGAERLLHLLRRSDAKNVVVIVTRWHGGIHLGNDRFKHINKCASDLLQQRGRPAAEASTTSDPKETRKKSSKKHK